MYKIGWEVDALCYDEAQAQLIMSKWDVSHQAPPAGMGAMMRRYNYSPGESDLHVSSRTTGALPRTEKTEKTENDTYVPWKLLSSTQLELPRINDNYYNNMHYCVIYGWTALSLIRLNICNNSEVYWQATGPDQYPSEAVFVANSDPTRQSIHRGALENQDIYVETDGVLVAVVFDGVSNESSVVVLNASSLEELASATSSIFTPFSIHGTWDKGYAT